MAYLLDSNILLRYVEPAHPMHPDAVNAVAALLAAGEQVCILPQSVSEFWNVCTRPADKNGLGWTPAQTDKEVTRIEQLITVILDIPTIYGEWRQLVANHNVAGVQVHDARIAAAMKAHGLTHLVTFNTKDFRRYTGINAVTPAEVIASYAAKSPPEQ